MKSLKRTLCLVLALVMVLGLFGIASATSFTDDNTIQYKEAVDVMTGIGAINGMGDGTFNPKGTITRAQAAKLVTFAVLGEAGANGLTGVSSSFSDVTVEAGFGWAIPSIEYLVREGVINGMGDGTFDPNGEISSTATLKMLLCALGYGKKGEYTGTGWDLKVTLDANKVGLTAGRTSTASVETPATREEVALYCFNTIQTQQVEYISTLDVYTKKEIETDVPETIMNTVYGAGNGNLTKLAYNAVDAQGNPAGGKDAFDAPANVWTFKNKPIGAYAVKELVAYTSEQTLAKVTADLKGYTVNAAVYKNGKAEQAAVTTAAAIQALTGNGTVVKVYATGTTVDTVVQIKTDVATVELVDTAKKTVTIHTATEGATTADDYIIDSDHALYSVVSGLAEKDYVLVTLAQNEAANGYNVVAASVPSQVTGRVTTVNVAQKSVTLNGTTSYGVAATTASSITAPDDATSSTVIWLDGYGYVVASKTTTATTAKFAYVLDTYTTLTGGKLVNMAKVVYTNGTTGDIAIKNPITGQGQQDPIIIAADAFVVLGNPDSDGIYTLTAPTDQTDKATGSTSGTPATVSEQVKAMYAALAGKIEATDKSLTNAAMNASPTQSTSYVGNYYSSNVKFIYIKDKTVTVLDGVQAVKSIPANSKAIIERYNNTDTGVVTAVILPDATPSGAVDTSKLVYLPATATITNDTGNLDPQPDTSDGHSPVAAPVATTTLHDSSTDKDVKVPVFNAYINGVQQPIPSTSSVQSKTYNMVGFYTMAPVPNVAGQYELIPYDDTDADVKAAVGAETKTAFETILTITPAGQNPTDLVLQIANATVVDVRAADAQTAAPITPTAKGLIAAMRSYDLNVSVLYDSKAGTASMIYINGADEKQAPKLTAEVSISNGGNAALKWDGTSGALEGTPDKLTLTVTKDSSDSTTPTFSYEWTVAKDGGNAVAVEGTPDNDGSYTPVPEDFSADGSYVFAVKVTNAAYNDATKSVTITVTAK